MTNFNCLGKQGCIDAYINGLKTKRPLLVVALNISTAQNYNHTHCDSWVTRRDVKAHYCLVGAESDISQRYGLHYGNQIFAVMSVCTLLQCYTIFFVWWISRRKPGQSQEERTMVLIGDVVADYLDYPSNMPRSQAVCAYPQVRCRKRGFRGPGLSAAAFIPHIISARDSSSIGYSSRFRSLLGAPGLNMSIPAIVKLGFSLNPGYLGLLVTFLGAVPPPGGEEIPARVHAAEDVVLPTLPAPHHVTGLLVHSLVCSHHDVSSQAPDWGPAVFISNCCVGDSDMHLLPVSIDVVSECLDGGGGLTTGYHLPQLAFSLDGCRVTLA
ncbi:hypothetical protein EYZ11_011867 [Aspergillus tanneri]|uniref:Uncharacterized protein n=1 Tax=Aspergillus tanneri TaxID=1220188 RepID=A0A4S3J3T8_9EURO|nr:hypothetical protein EYZ11_011867 [Aspergillus tanneri]